MTELLAAAVIIFLLQELFYVLSKSRWGYSPVPFGRWLPEPWANLLAWAVFAFIVFNVIREWW
jgi:hypothetical protein